MTPGDDSLAPPPTMRTVVRALVLLEHIAKAGKPVGISELARSTGIPKTTVHRLVAVLSAHGLAVPSGRGLVLGAAPPALIASSRTLLCEALRWQIMPFLVDLYEVTHDVVLLGVLDRDEVEVLASVYSHRRSDSVPEIRSRRPVRCAMGAVLLAFRDDLARPNLVEGVTSFDVGLSPSRIRSTGFALCESEDAPGVVEIAVPVSGAQGVVAAIARFRPASSSDGRALDWQRRVAAAASANLRGMG